MNGYLNTLFERWTQGERTPALYAFGALAAPASLLYRAALIARPPLTRRFEKLDHTRLIVISSPVTGGVGKTPVTALLARGLVDTGKTPAIVTMGYGRASRGDAVVMPSDTTSVSAEMAGDEAVELCRLSGCAVHVGDEPADVIGRLDRDNPHGTILFDDGVSRTWTEEKRLVVLSDADVLSPVRYLPLGRWRTTPRFLRHASYVAVTSTADTQKLDDIASRLHHLGYDGPTGLFGYRVDGLAEWRNGSIVLLARQPEGRPLAFCGIARPLRFLEQARPYGASPGAFHTFPDHHRYTSDDLAALDRARRAGGCGWFLTTLKDAVKIDPDWIGSTPLVFLRIALHQIAGPDLLAVLAKDG